MDYQNTPASDQSTDLFTSEPVTYAGFWERFAAAFIDGLIIGAGTFFLSYSIGKPDELIGIDDFLSLIISWLYAALQESSAAQATIGKRALGIKVTDMNGQRISFGQATGRHFGKYISGLILLIGYLMMLWDDKKQTLHDKMAGTLVVKA